MSKVIQCPCGYVMSAEDEEVLVVEAQRHARDVHGMDLTSEQALAMARPA